MPDVLTAAHRHGELVKSLAGVISDRLRAALKPGDRSWNPPRGTEPPVRLPKGVHGERLGGKPGRKARG